VQFGISLKEIVYLFQQGSIIGIDVLAVKILPIKQATGCLRIATFDFGDIVAAECI